MNTLSLVIAIVALVIAVLAFKRTGGVINLRKSTASLLAKMEQVVSNETKTGEKMEQAVSNETETVEKKKVKTTKET
jgi:hypothetical protein